MSEYPVNRGIGKPVEFKGLKSQYLFIFCGGLLAVFVVFIVLFMAGVNQWLCIGFIVSASLLLVWQTFRLNAKYGTHGLMKAAARKRHPRFIISRKAIPRLFNYKRRKEEYRFNLCFRMAMFTFERVGMYNNYPIYHMRVSKKGDPSQIGNKYQRKEEL